MQWASKEPVSEKQYLDFYEFKHWRAFEGPMGCIASRPCEKCRHLVTDSSCLCIGYFVCPNCGHENGKQIRLANEESRRRAEEEAKNPKIYPQFDRTRFRMRYLYGETDVSYTPEDYSI